MRSTLKLAKCYVCKQLWLNRKPVMYTVNHHRVCYHCIGASKQAMRYTRGTIDVATRQGKVTIPATIAVDTGLAYHGYLYMDNTVMDRPLEVSHVHTGLAIKQVDTPTQAKRVISKLLELKTINWKLKNPLENLSSEEYNSTKQAIRNM